MSWSLVRGIPAGFSLQLRFFCWLSLGECGPHPPKFKLLLFAFGPLLCVYMVDLLYSYVIVRSYVIVYVIVNNDSCGVHNKRYPYVIVNNVSCGVHNRPYHMLCVSLTVVHAIGHIREYHSSSWS